MIAVSWSPPLPPDQSPRPKTLHDIIVEVARKHKLTFAEMVGQSRRRSLAWPRQEAMWRCAKETSASLPEIGRALGNRDHTTILYGVRAHEKRLGGDNDDGSRE